MALNDEQNKSGNSTSETSIPKTIPHSPKRSWSCTQSNFEDKALTETENDSVSSPSDKAIAFDDESFFKFGYQGLVKSREGKWKELLNNPETDHHFEKNILGIEYVVDDENARSKKTKAEFMTWEPVEPPGKKRKVGQTCISPAVEQDHTKYEKYNVYFDGCSEHLRENGSNFDSVEKFHEWFHYEWEAHLYGIRNLVQQHIYREEMSQYQKTKEQNK